MAYFFTFIQASSTENLTEKITASAGFAEAASTALQDFLICFEVCDDLARSDKNVVLFIDRSNIYSCVHCSRIVGTDVPCCASTCICVFLRGVQSRIFNKFHSQTVRMIA